MHEKLLKCTESKSLLCNGLADMSIFSCISVFIFLSFVMECPKTRGVGEIRRGESVFTSETGFFFSTIKQLFSMSNNLTC